MSAMDRAALALATWFGAGYFPFASGTLATALALPLPWAAWVLAGRGAQGWAWPCLALALLLFLPGVASASAAERITGEHDSHKIVVDEVVGTLLTLGFLPWAALGHAGIYVWAFFIFRALDVAKPGLINTAQLLPRGWGVMMDDCLAGLVGGLLILALWHWLPGLALLGLA
jgi:phosphatidylglycerophosphatase A